MNLNHESNADCLLVNLKKGQIYIGTEPTFKGFFVFVITVEPDLFSFKLISS
jgi:hypothetical protein